MEGEGREVESVSKRARHSCSPSACCDVTRAGKAARPWGCEARGGGNATVSSPDLAEPPRAANVDCNKGLCRFQLTWPQLFDV